MLKTIVATFQTVMGSSLSLSQQSAIETIHQWRSRPPHELIFDSGRREISQYMQAVDRIQQSPPNVKGPTNELISTAMDRLRREFIAVLSRQADHHVGPISTTESSVADSTAYAFRYEEYVVSEPPSKDVISYLRNIVGRMNSSGRIGECIKAYKSVRKSFLQSQLKRLRFEELGIGYNTRRTMWDELKVKMELWVQVSKICVKILFRREKELCELIFGGLVDDSTKDECFVGTVEEFAIDLFRFAEEMSLSNQPYERLEPILGVYDAFLWVLPDSKALFLCESGKRIRNICAEISLRIQKKVERMLSDLGHAVLHEISDNNSDERGGVHPSTEYVMEKIDHIVRNKNMLEKLIKSTPSLAFGDQIIPEEALGNSYSSLSFFERHLIVIVAALKLNLEVKSKCHKNPSLGQLFMMNNVRYIIGKIEESNELQEMISDSYIRLLNEAFKSAMVSYQASTCRRFLACFEDDGLYITRCFKLRPSKTALRKRLSAFNAVYEETRSVHSLWTIPDSQLRQEVRVSMSEKLVPAYRSFLEKFENNPETNLILKKNTKYLVDGLETLI